MSVVGHCVAQDYRMYLDFVLAMMYRNTQQSMNYMFQALDLQHKGFIDEFTIKYFYRDVSAKLQGMGIEPPDVEDVCVEIFDMAKPEVEGYITMKDLKECKVSAVCQSCIRGCSVPIHLCRAAAASVCAALMRPPDCVARSWLPGHRLCCLGAHVLMSADGPHCIVHSCRCERLLGVRQP